jgi:hypothetical protein
MSIRHVPIRTGRLGSTQLVVSQVKVLSMKEPPAQSFAHLLRDLHAIPGEFIACLDLAANRQ